VKNSAKGQGELRKSCFGNQFQAETKCRAIWGRQVGYEFTTTRDHLSGHKCIGLVTEMARWKFQFQ
jgi:hypothetical protein